MTRRLRTLIPVLALGMLPPLGSAHAQCETISAADPQAMVTLLQASGAAEVTQDQEGDPLITGRMEGISYAVYFYGCTNGQDCTDVQFTAGFTLDTPVTLDQINSWNYEKRFGKAYLDTQGDAVIEMNVNLDGGVCTDNFQDTVDFWGLVLREFTGHIGY